jgi:sugar fermentation stimulation protein A
MRFPQPLRRGRLLRRYKRFFADVVLDEVGEVTAHVPNSGKMLGLLDEGNPCWLSRSDAPGRKLPWTLELIEAPGGVLVGVNTFHPNRLAAEGIAAGVVPELAGYADLRREVRYGAGSRVDILLTHPDRPPCWVEVKNVHLLRTPGLYEFPDCVTERGLKHLGDLAERAEAGERAVMLFVVQRGDGSAFDTAADCDPAYAAGLLRAAERGVEVLVYDCDVTPEAIALNRRAPWLSAETVTAP